MKLTTYDKPIGSAKATPLYAEEPSLRALCLAHGLHPNAAYRFKARHPECAHWSHEQVVEQMLANKDQSAVARRQGQVPGNGRSCFGGIRYA